MKQEIPIMLCFDRNYVIPAGVAMYSLLENADKQYNYIIYVCHTDISDDDQEKLRQAISCFKNARFEFINMNGRFDREFKNLNVQGHYSKEVLYKLLVGSLFPQHEKIIVTDVDVVFTGDIAKHYIGVWDRDDFCVAGIRPIMPQGTYLHRFYDEYKRNFSETECARLSLCGGYLIFNLKRLRQNDCAMEKLFVQYLENNANRLKQAEQDIINLVVPETEKVFLPLDALVCSYCYDIFKYTEDYNTDAYYSADEIKTAMNAPIQLHYASPIKPWREPGVTKGDIWFKYLAKTCFVTDWCRYMSMYVKPVAQIGSQNWMRRICQLPIVFRRRFFLALHRVKFAKNSKKPKVVVVCLTYNHEKTIRRTLDGFVGQQVNFPVEFIISDDASTDGTVDIIREYAEKYPDIITPVLHAHNRGVAENAISALRRAHGDYLAWCDGDDYWIDSKKLQKQVRILKRHKDCSIVCTNVKRHYVNGEKPDSVFKVKKYMPRKMARKSSYNFEDLLKCRFIASCTTMFRWQLDDIILPSWLSEHVVIDFPIFLIHAHFGNIRVLNDVTAQYNISPAGVSNAANTPEYRHKMQNILRYVDKYLNFEHTNSINNYISKNKL